MHGRGYLWTRDEGNMFKILGMILLMIGSTGFAWSYCNGEKERITQIKNIRQMYRSLQNEILYSGASIPDLCLSMSGKAPAPYAQAFLDIYKEISKNNGSSFNIIWNDVMSYYIKETSLKSAALKDEEKRLLLDFPECLGYPGREAQAESLDRFIREADRISSSLEKEIADKTKVIMSFGVMGGILISLLLL